MALDATARERLMRQYAPRLAGAVDVHAVSPVDDQIEDIEDDLDGLEEDVDELENIVDPNSPDDPDQEQTPDGEQLDPQDEEEPESPALSKPLQRAYAVPRDVTTTQPFNGMNLTTATVGVGGAGGGGSTQMIWTPVVTTLGSRTILTAPATTERASMWGEVPNPNPHLMWMQGRFVGAERPNKNGAYWSTADLEVGRPTITHGPLNWLHEDKHVIGTIADARFIPATGGGGLQLAAETAAETSDPHIAALSAIWRWVYPQEASVVQMASDAGLLAYSMECISEAVQCVGEAGCGQSFGYMDFAQGKACAHLKERATTRRLVNPTFLGGAVIVPPSRPGWADADARVMAAVSGLAEQAYDQAGRPDIPATTWDQLMAGVVRFAEAETGASG